MLGLSDTSVEGAKSTLADFFDRAETVLPAGIREWLAKHSPADMTHWSIAAVLVLSALILLLVLRLVRRRAAPGAGPSLADLTQAPRRAAYLISFVLVFGMGTWSYVAPLQGAAMAPGVISPDGHRRTVQHLEGGIIRAINVREGDVVTEGQVLLTLDDVEARARLGELGNRHVHLLARAARLEAEQLGSEDLEIPTDATILDPAELDRALANQREVLTQRIAARNGRDEILRLRVRQLEAENVGLDHAIAGLDEKRMLIEDELGSVTKLLGKGLERKNRLLDLERVAADIRIDRATREAQIARNAQSIGETEMQLLTMHQEDTEAGTEELAEVRRAVAELEAEMKWRADVLDRTEIRSPISGTVMNLRVTTLSGVVRNGEPILDIVPAQVPLIIDAKVRTVDIDVIRVGMKARVILSAYQQRNMPQIYGSLRSISADRLVEDRTGESFYLAKIEVPRSELDPLPGVELVSGMPVEVMLQTGESTVADYVLGPLIGSLRRSFHENHGS